MVEEGTTYKKVSSDNTGILNFLRPAETLNFARFSKFQTKSLSRQKQHVQKPSTYGPKRTSLNGTEDIVPSTEMNMLTCLLHTK